MAMVGVGYIINVVQDSFETALNSSGDVLFTATAEYRYWRKTGKSLPTFLGGTTFIMYPTPTIAMAVSCGMPKSEQAIGISSREPPATPEVPQAASVESRESTIAEGMST